MAKHTRQLPARPKPNRLALELLEDRSLPSGMAGGACDPPPPAAHGPAAVASDSPPSWRQPGMDTALVDRSGETSPAPGPAGLSAGRDFVVMTPPERAPSWDYRSGRPDFGDPIGYGRAPANPFSAPPAVAQPVVVEWVVVTRQFVDADAPTASVDVRLPVHEPSNTAPSAAEAKGERVHASIGKPAVIPDGGEPAISLLLANAHANAVNLDPPSPAVVALAGRLALGSAAPELVRPGDLASQFATSVRSGDGRGPLAVLDVARADALPANRPPARETASGFNDVVIPLTPSADEVPSGDARTDHAGLLPLDPGALGRGVQQLFRRLGILGREAQGESSWSRLAPWFVVVVAAGFGVAWVRRMPRSAPAPDPAEPPRRGLAWRWSDEFSTPVPLDTL
jgi:hypothetical protein